MACSGSQAAKQSHLQRICGLISRYVLCLSKCQVSADMTATHSLHNRSLLQLACLTMVMHAQVLCVHCLLCVCYLLQYYFYHVDIHISLQKYITLSCLLNFRRACLEHCREWTLRQLKAYDAPPHSPRNLHQELHLLCLLRPLQHRTTQLMPLTQV